MANNHSILEFALKNLSFTSNATTLVGVAKCRWTNVYEDLQGVCAVDPPQGADILVVHGLPNSQDSSNHKVDCSSAHHVDHCILHLQRDDMSAVSCM